MEVVAKRKRVPTTSPHSSPPPAPEHMEPFHSDTGNHTPPPTSSSSFTSVSSNSPPPPPPFFFVSLFPEEIQKAYWKLQLSTFLSYGTRVPPLSNVVETLPPDHLDRENHSRQEAMKFLLAPFSSIFELEPQQHQQPTEVGKKKNNRMKPKKEQSERMEDTPSSWGISLSPAGEALVRRRQEESEGRKREEGVVQEGGSGGHKQQRLHIPVTFHRDGPPSTQNTAASHPPTVYKDSASRNRSTATSFFTSFSSFSPVPERGHVFSSFEAMAFSLRQHRPPSPARWWMAVDSFQVEENDLPRSIISSSSTMNRDDLGKGSPPASVRMKVENMIFHLPSSYRSSLPPPPPYTSTSSSPPHAPPSLPSSRYSNWYRWNSFQSHVGKSPAGDSSPPPNTSTSSSSPHAPPPPHIVLAAHWDSKREPQGMLGASDSAASILMLRQWMQEVLWWKELAQLVRWAWEEEEEKKANKKGGKEWWFQDENIFSYLSEKKLRILLQKLLHPASAALLLEYVFPAPSTEEEGSSSSSSSLFSNLERNLSHTCDRSSISTRTPGCTASHHHSSSGGLCVHENCRIEKGEEQKEIPQRKADMDQWPDEVEGVYQALSAALNLSLPSSLASRLFTSRAKTSNHPSPSTSSFLSLSAVFPPRNHHHDHHHAQYCQYSRRPQYSLREWLIAGERLPDVSVIFFDGEEAMVEWKGDDHTYGSRHLSATWRSTTWYRDAKRSGDEKGEGKRGVEKMVGKRKESGEAEEGHTSASPSSGTSTTATRTTATTHTASKNVKEVVKRASSWMSSISSFILLDLIGGSEDSVFRNFFADVSGHLFYELYLLEQQRRNPCGSVNSRNGAGAATGRPFSTTTTTCPRLHTKSTLKGHHAVSSEGRTVAGVPALWELFGIPPLWYQPPLPSSSSPEQPQRKGNVGSTSYFTSSEALRSRHAPMRPLPNLVLEDDYMHWLDAGKEKEEEKEDDPPSLEAMRHKKTETNRAASEEKEKDSNQITSTPPPEHLSCAMLPLVPMPFPPQWHTIEDDISHISWNMIIHFYELFLAFLFFSPS